MKLVAADPSLLAARDALTHDAWGSGLSVAQFQAREVRLRSHPWTRKTMRSWFWVDARGTVLSSCETFLDVARVGARVGTAATIASVFTERSQRGRGHAAAMLRALIDHHRADHSCLAMTLFSEIDTAFYARLGFIPVPSFDTWHDASADRPQVTWLESPVAPVHPPADDETLRLDLSDPRLEWAIERERIWQGLLNTPVLHHHGARVAASTITWTAYWRENALHVLSIDLRDEAHLPALLAAARYAAHSVGLPTVRIWETRAIESGRRAARTDEVPMFLPLINGVTAWTRVERGLWA